MKYAVTCGDQFLTGIDSSRRYSKNPVYQWSRTGSRFFSKSEAESLVDRIRRAGGHAEVKQLGCAGK